MTLPKDEDLTLRLNAYLDGELDPIAAREIERTLSIDLAAAKELAGLEALREALRSDLAGDVPSENLSRQIEALANPAPRRVRVASWQALAASALIGALVAVVGDCKQQADITRRNQDDEPAGDHAQPSSSRRRRFTRRSAIQASVAMTSSQATKM